MSIKVDFNLYLISNRKLFADEDSFFTAVENSLQGGVRAFQLREKDLPTRDLLFMAMKMRELTSKYSSKLFINNRVDIALCVCADGVHMGQTGIPAYAARKIAGGRLTIGVSAHNLKEAEAAEKEGADFVTFGPVYQTSSKLKYGEPVGLKSLKETTEKIGLPVFGIGGIKLDTADAVMRAGAHGVAVISGILAANDAMKAAERYLKELTEEEPQRH